MPRLDPEVLTAVMEPRSASPAVRKVNLPPKKRRTHYKSRRGCKECKQRHVKCDEQRPVCLQCSTLDRSCSYAYVIPDPPVPDGSSPLSKTTPLASPPAPAAQQLPPQVFNLGHLALLHHVETDLMRPPYTHFIADEKNSSRLLRMIIQSALSTPFLMDEVLAFAALHLSVLESDVVKKNHHRDQAAQLQIRALALFNGADIDITEQNCTAMFLFSSFIGMHMLHDAAANQPNLLGLLERFVEFVGLYRGVGVITTCGWQTIRNSELNSIINVIEAVDESNAPSGRSCDGLLGLLETAKERLGPSQSKACYDAVQALQWVFDQYDLLPEPINRHILLAWPIRISIEFLDLLRRRHAEALAIMAHWALLLHYERNFWVFGHGGQYLIEAITSFLGPSWDEWLAWPKQSLELSR